MGGERLDARNPTSKLMLTILAGVATSPAAFALAMPSRCRSSMTSRAQRRGADQAAEARVGSHRDRGASRHRPQRCGIVRPAWAGRHPLDAMVFGLQPLPLSATRAQRNCDRAARMRDGCATERHALCDGSATDGHALRYGWGTPEIRMRYGIRHAGAVSSGTTSAPKNSASGSARRRPRARCRYDGSRVMVSVCAAAPLSDQPR